MIVVLLAESSYYFTEDPGSWSLFFSRVAEFPEKFGREELLFLLIMARLFLFALNDGD